MGGDSYIYTRDGVQIDLGPMEEGDLRLLLRLLPEKTSVRILRVRDSRAKCVGDGVLKELENVPEGLEEIVWNGQEKVVWKLEKGADGKVRGCRTGGT